MSAPTGPDRGPSVTVPDWMLEEQSPEDEVQQNARSLKERIVTSVALQGGVIDGSANTGPESASLTAPSDQVREACVDHRTSRPGRVPCLPERRGVIRNYVVPETAESASLAGTCWCAGRCGSHSFHVPFN